MKDNKLIAEFMGLVRSSVVDKYWTKKDSEGIGFGQLKELRYDTDWNWLMQVVEKINNQNNVVQIHENHAMVVNNTKGEMLVDVVSGSMIEATYEAVVEYIKLQNNGRV